MSNQNSQPVKLSSAYEQREFVISGANLWKWWQQARQQAIAHHISPTEADWLLQALTNLDRLALRLETFKTQEAIPLAIAPEDLTNLWQKRVDQRTPVQYLVGKTSWREFSFTVSAAVLIPRPETELLIDLAIAATQDNADLRGGHWADLGTGSGAIAIGLATAFPKATLHAVDQSLEALAISQANAGKYQLHERIHFYQGSWFTPLKHLQSKLSGMISNPPYIPSQMVLELQPEVTQHEPHLALDGGTDGLECLRHLITTAPDYLRSGGVWMVEMMAGQAEAVANLLEQNGCYHRIQIHSDLAGIERFASAYRN